VHSFVVLLTIILICGWSRYSYVMFSRSECPTSCDIVMCGVVVVYVQVCWRCNVRSRVDNGGLCTGVLAVSVHRAIL